jgi:hypothetical protein
METEKMSENFDSDPAMTRLTNPEGSDECCLFCLELKWYGMDEVFVSHIVGARKIVAVRIQH